MDSKYYYIAFKTKEGDGTGSDVKLQMYGADGKKIGDEFEVTSLLHDITGNALSSGSYQLGIFEMAKPASITGLPEVYFLGITMQGSDAWSCEYIQVAPAPAGWWKSSEWPRKEMNKLANSTDADKHGEVYHKYYLGIREALDKGATFTFNQTLSTNSDEGPTSSQTARDGYHPKTIGKPTPSDRTQSSFNITNNIDGLSEVNSAAEEIKKIRRQNISLTEAGGGSNSQSFTVGVTVGYSAGQVGGYQASVSTSFTAAWTSWHSKQTIKTLEDTSSHTYTFPSSKVPAQTLRIREISVSYEVDIVTVTNGIGKPAKIELIKQQVLDTPSDTTHDIVKANAKAKWPALKARMIQNDPLLASKMASYEKDMTDAGWL